MTKKKYLGHLLVANPNNPRDELSKSVMLLVTHNQQNAIGLQINNAVDQLNLKTIVRLNNYLKHQCFEIML